MRLAPGSVRNWATAEDDEYIRMIKHDLQIQLRRQKQLLYVGCNPYGVGGATIKDVKDWNRRNPEFAISTNTIHKGGGQAPQREEPTGPL